MSIGTKLETTTRSAHAKPLPEESQPNMRGQFASPARWALSQVAYKRLRDLMIVCLPGAFALLVAILAFSLHVNLSTAGSLEFFLILMVALRMGILQATIVSVIAFLCLNFLFTDPLFTFNVSDPQNWVSLLTFEVAAMFVSSLSAKVRSHGIHLEEQRLRAVKLYEFSRAVLLVDQRIGTEEQLSALVRDIIEVEEVQIWVVPEIRGRSANPVLHTNREAHETFLANEETDDLEARRSRRLLRLGASAIGGMTMRAWKIDSLTADAVASIAAITFERVRAIQRENRAEMERDAERLRAAVLDGLAHAFKTPLTAIQTASSGLLAIDHLDAVHTELVSIIDERATMLSQLTTRLLQTADLEAREIRLRRKSASIVDVLDRVLEAQDERTRSRTSIKLPEELREDYLDIFMMQLALQQLVDNASKYSEIDSPILITVTQTSLETDIVVQNDASAGMFIRPEDEVRIFERFYRGADAYGPSGTGLGLSIAKKIAEAHGGFVRVQCEHDTTRFSFSLQHYKKEGHG